jgi:hypothetical protein
MKQMVETWLRKKFVELHGEGAPNQADFYRCQVCGRLVTWNKIRKADMCCSGRLVPVNPTPLEVAKVFLFPWTI